MPDWNNELIIARDELGVLGGNCRYAPQNHKHAKKKTAEAVFFRSVSSRPEQVPLC